MSQKELEQRLSYLEKENKRLKEENAYLRFELEELRLKRYKTGKPPPAEKSGSQSSSSPKKKGGLFGHIGWFRKKPKKIDRVKRGKVILLP